MENKNKNYSIGEAFQALDSFLDEPIEVDSEIIADENDVVKLKEGYVGQTLDDFFNVCTDAGVIEKITVCNTDIDDYDESVLLEGGSYDDIPQNVLEASFSDFDVGGGTIVINCSEEEGGTDFYQTVQDFIDDYNGDEVEICVDGETVFTGDKSEVPNEYLEYMFNSFDTPEYISVNVTDVEDIDIDNLNEKLSDSDKKRLKDEIAWCKEVLNNPSGRASAEAQINYGKDYRKRVKEDLARFEKQLKEYSVEESNNGLDESDLDLDGETKNPLKESKSFNIGDSKDLEDALDFVNKDEDEETIEQVIDLDAETEEDLSPTYVGKVLGQCTTCHSLIYMEPDSLVKAEDVDSDTDEDIYNVDEECVVCGAKDGYVLLGKVVPIEDKEVDKVDEPKEDETEDDGADNKKPEGEEPKGNIIEEPLSESYSKHSNYFRAYAQIDEGDDSLGIDEPVFGHYENAFDTEEEAIEAAKSFIKDVREGKINFKDGSITGCSVVEIADEDTEEIFFVDIEENLTESTITEVAGGMSKGLSVEDIAAKHGVSVEDIEDQIKLGVKVEQEHTSDVEEAKKIAMDHLTEFPDYYDRLGKMEKEAKADSVDSDEIEDLDENKFDSLINSCLKESTYKTTDGFIDGNKIRLEGTTTNKDGITSSTQFMFESFKMDNKIIKLKGINESLGSEFTLLGKQDKNTFIPKIIKKKNSK